MNGIRIFFSDLAERAQEDMDRWDEDREPVPPEVFRQLIERVEELEQVDTASRALLATPFVDDDFPEMMHNLQTALRLPQSQS